MPELRKDVIMGRWVIIATERAKRPSDFTTGEPPGAKAGLCPFCSGNEDKTPPEITAYREKGTAPNSPGWHVRVVPNKFPALGIEGNLDKRGEGIYDFMRGVGAHEVIIETPSHASSISSLSEANIQEVLWIYRDRLVDLRRDRRMAFGLIFKNVGEAAGASLEHTHSQLIVTPIVPKRIQEEIDGGHEFYRYRGRCVFCDIVQQEISSGKRLVLDTPNFLVFEPFASRFPFETWVLPKQHASHFEDIQKVEIDDLSVALKVILIKLEKSLSNPPYNYVIHTSPFNFGSLEHYHWHLEIIPRLTKVAGFEWGTGFYINPVPPENAAEYLRGVDGK